MSDDKTLRIEYDTESRSVIVHLPGLPPMQRKMDRSGETIRWLCQKIAKKLRQMKLLNKGDGPSSEGAFIKECEAKFGHLTEWRGQ